MAMPRVAGGWLSAMAPAPTVRHADDPNACSTRKPMSDSTFHANPHATEVAAKMAVDTSTTPRRPYWSERGPHTSGITPSTTR
jgi:hypothetical protein